jgi:1-acyl-sn-glycerol-3-phosphate acyltransferase
LYQALDLPVVPVALNSGCFWGRRAFSKRAGTIDLRVLPPISPGLSRRAFLTRLQGEIDTASDALARDAEVR